MGDSSEARGGMEHEARKVSGGDRRKLGGNKNSSAYSSASSKPKYCPLRVIGTPVFIQAGIGAPRR